MMATHNNNGLQKLKGSDFEVRDGYTDIRGWDVKDGNGRTIGEVDELLFDPATQKVRYMIVDLDDNEFDVDDHDVLIPIGVAELHENDDDVIIPAISAEQLRSLPEYDEDNFSTEHEQRIHHVFAGMGLAGGAVAAAAAAGTQQDSGSGFYDHDHYNEDNLYRNRRNQGTGSDSIPVIREDLEIGKREVETGGVRVRSRINEEEVTEHVNLRDESVQVERTPADRPASEADLREENIEMREHSEVPVVHKEARVVEEINLHKDVAEHDETIRDSVRNTEVDIENTGRKHPRTDDDERL